jgi:hypothetical protein
MDDASNPLAALRDIHLPPNPGIWPPAPGWWLVAIAVPLICWLLLFIWKRYAVKMRPAREFRRRILELDIHSSEEQKLVAVQEISRLIRQFVICRYGREQVANLYGDRWLEFLNGTTKNEPEFTTGIGKILKDAPFRPKIDADLEDLRGYLVRWSKEA